MSFKIAMLGVENSHASTFMKCISSMDEFSDVEVVGVYSDEENAVAALVEKYGVKAMKSYDELVGKIDGLIITARHGDNHYKYAKPYISSGIPMFIDKPITCSESEAVEMMKELRKAGVKVTGGSSVRHDSGLKKLAAEVAGEVGGKTKFGLVRAPMQMHSVYGGFYFYAQHLAEAITEIFGKYPKAVTAKEIGDTVTAVYEYDSYNVTALYEEASGYYFAERHYEKEVEAIKLGANGMDEWFLGEFRDFVDLLRGKSEGRDYTEFIAPVFLLTATVRSLESGKRESVNPYTLD
jgi:predicted dehydrogenase